MKEQASYVYGFALESFDIGEYKGIDEKNNVYLEDCGGMCAVTSKVDLDEFAHPYIDENLGNLNWLKIKAERHMDVIKKAMEYTQIIPLKFCTVFYNDSNIKQFAQEHKKQLIENLSKLQGKEEWSCKIYWDKKEFMSNHMREEKEKIKGDSSNISKGAAYFMKKKLENSLNEQAICKVNLIIERIIDTLKDLVLESKVNKILAKEITGRNQDMVMNSSLLIDCREKELFLEKMKELNSKVEDYGLIFEYSGPWPLYNFIENLE
ncbi:MAG: hypothetical protein A2Y24_01740 [Clostridiales bacterium GWE2_32_10]|nr:MAG: hypothetical protein A2Y24_01740 [Clostridiales bacterium GWE2_32_10]HBY19670.1 hypothetical protein [Clostridiales bacterium]